MSRAAVLLVFAIACKGSPPQSPPTVPTTDAGVETTTFDPDPAVARPTGPTDGILRLTHIQMLTSIPELEQRVSDADALATAVQATIAKVVAFDASHPGVLGSEVEVWLAIKPRQRMRVWITAVPALSSEHERTIVADPRSEDVPVVVGGPVVLRLPLRRRDEPPGSPDEPRPLPAAWKSTMVDGPRTVDEMIAKAWPD